MTTRNDIFKVESVEDTFKHLNFRLKENDSDPVEIVVCGGCSLIVSGLVHRTTNDVDVLALMASGNLMSPDPLPETLLIAAKEVAEDLGLPVEWVSHQ
jgi:hypothetical protein